MPRDLWIASSATRPLLTHSPGRGGGGGDEVKKDRRYPKGRVRNRHRNSTAGGAHASRDFHRVYAARNARQMLC